MREPSDLKPISSKGTAAYSQDHFIKKWLIPSVVGVIIVIVGILTNVAVEKAIKDDLAGELQVILDADVAALRIWLEAQKRAVEAIIAEPEVKAGIQDLVALAGEQGTFDAALRVSQPLKNLRATLGPLCRARGYTDFL